MQYVFAVEALLVFDEKGTRFGPAVVHNIAESMAFVLGQTLEDRIEIEGRVKDIYSTRSAIAHGWHGSSVSRRELLSALSFSRTLVLDFLVRAEFRDFTSAKQLRDWLQVQRYSPATPPVPTAQAPQVSALVTPSGATGAAESASPESEGPAPNRGGRTP